MRLATMMACALFAVFSAASPASAEKRVALIVGMSAYKFVTPLANPGNDARLVAQTLNALGFTLIGDGPQLDLDKSKLEAAVQDFSRQMRGADVALFYYSGHGLQVRGENYLVPVAANPEREADIDFQLVDANLVLRQMEQAGTKLNVVILDACRNNPFSGRGFKALSRGLARMDAPEGTLISYATQPGNVALDGNDGNSPYTKALAQTMRQPGLDIFRMFNEVGLAVMQSTGSSQQPWLSASPIKGAFYFAGQPQSPIYNAPPTATGPDAAERAWALARDTTSQAVLEDFIRRFGDSFYATLAREKIEALKKSQAAVVAPPVAAPKPDAACGGATLASLGTRAARSLSAGEECALKPKDAFKECDQCPAMLVVPSGSFTMGSPASEPERSSDESPQRTVTFAKPFAAGKFSVTFEEWDACVADGGCNNYRPSDSGWGRGKRPVINVSWDDAKTYVAWISRKTGQQYRLLSEAEREYVTRAGTATPYWWGMTISKQQANYSSDKTLPVDTFQPNPWGLYQVHGNVYDWVEDCYKDSYVGAPTDGSAMTSGECKYRVLRGGSWFNVPRFLRSAFRGWYSTGDRNDSVGFRLGRALTP